MRRFVLLCLGAVSCASPDVPKLDGVPEDPGLTPGLPVTPVHPGGTATPPVGLPSGEADGTRTAEKDSDAGAPGSEPDSLAPPTPSTGVPPVSSEDLTQGLGQSSAPSVQTEDSEEPPRQADAGAQGLDAGPLDAGESSSSAESDSEANSGGSTSGEPDGGLSSSEEPTSAPLDAGGHADAP